MRRLVRERLRRRPAAVPAPSSEERALERPFTAYTVPDWHVPLSMVTAGLPDWVGSWGRSRNDVTVTRNRSSSAGWRRSV